MKKMIQIGAGNIGRACIGRLFSDIGYQIYFSDVNQELLNLLSSKKEYNVRIVGQNLDNTICIKNVDRVPEDTDKLLSLFDEIDIITTAVGVNILPKIAPFIADAISRRYKTKNEKLLNIMACENTIGASDKLKEAVYSILDDDIKNWMNGKIAFSNVAVDSIVPTIKNDDPLTVTSESFAELIIDKTTFLGEIQETEGLILKENLEAYVQRKLFTLNTGHAITAYLGFEYNKSTIYDAINDDNIKNIVFGAMQESGNVLIKRYGFTKEEHSKYIDKILNRFFNPYLEDSVLRVGREPLRKLSYNDRLIKPIRGAIEYNIEYKNLLRGVISAFKFYNSEDEESIRLKKMLEEENLYDIIIKITGLENEPHLVDEIYSHLKNKE